MRMEMLIGAAVLACSASCSRDESGPASTPTETALGDDVVARVNGTVITKDRFLRHISSYPEHMRNNEKLREHFLQELIDQFLLEGEAKRVGLEQDQEYLRKMEAFRHDTLLGMMMRTLENDEADVSEEDAKAYFESHPDEFKHPERLHVRHIQVATKKEANEILKLIQAGESFEELALKRSQDTSTAAQAGDLGTFSSQQRPEFAAASKSMKEGDVKGPVELRGKVHLLKLVRRIPAKDLSFENAKNNLINRLRAEQSEQRKAELVKQLRESADIATNSETFKSTATATRTK